MSALVDAPEIPAGTSVGDRLQAETTAVRLHIRWPGTRKSLNEDQKRRAASTFDADTRSLSAAKRIFDTTHPAFRAVSSVRSKAVSYWKGMTLPYVEAGVRLIRRDDVASFNSHLTSMQEELAEAVGLLNGCYSELVEHAREQLGNLFDRSDYPDSVDNLFEISWDFPSLTPPAYLRTVNPQLYEAECRRVQARFAEAVELAEQTFAEELAQLVNHLSERLSGSTDGKRKVFRDSAIENLNEFFDRFQRLSICGSAELDQLVSDARNVVRGITPQDLRDQRDLRERVSQSLGEVESHLDLLMSDRPRRNIVRKPR